MQGVQHLPRDQNHEVNNNNPENHCEKVPVGQRANLKEDTSAELSKCTATSG